MRLTVLRVPAAAAEIAADRLWSVGARGVEEIEVTGGVELRAVLATEDSTSRDRLGELPHDWIVEFIDVEDAPSEAWRDHAVPIDVNDELTIVPAWQVHKVSNPSRTQVAIEPAGSFGLGDHPTTRLSADAAWRLLVAGDRVLDAGCGSGVLSIIAALRGASHVVAVDIADAAREATTANAELNGVPDVIDASTTPVPDVDGQFDVVLANILAPTLVELADDLKRLTSATGCLVISGILAEAYEHVARALAPMQAEPAHVLDGWAAVEFRHPST